MNKLQKCESLPHHTNNDHNTKKNKKIHLSLEISLQHSHSVLQTYFKKYESLPHHTTMLTTIINKQMIHLSLEIALQYSHLVRKHTTNSANRCSTLPPMLTTQKQKTTQLSLEITLQSSHSGRKHTKNNANRCHTNNEITVKGALNSTFQESNIALNSTWPRQFIRCQGCTEYGVATISRLL